MSVRITCIKKNGGYHENPYTAIESMKWINDSNNETGTTSRLGMYKWVKDGGIAYVQDAQDNKAELIHTETALGTKYVKTKADDVKSDNLLSLPECK